MSNVVPIIREPTADECLAQIKVIIAYDETNAGLRTSEWFDLHKQMAELIESARNADPKLTQIKVGEAIGKAQSWVAAVIKWRAAGYPPEGPFAKQAKAAREKKKLSVATDNGDDCPTCNLPAGRDRRATFIKEEKYRAAGLEDRVVYISEDQRDKVIDYLRKLSGGEYAPDSMLAWTDLIVRAAPTKEE